MTQQTAMDAAMQSYEQLSDGCRELQSESQAEQARIAAEEAARRQRHSCGSRLSEPTRIGQDRLVAHVFQ